MQKSSYSAAAGRLKAVSLSFLKKEQLFDLIKSKDTSEIAQKLSSTWYGPHIESAASIYKPPELIEVALNRHLVMMNRLAIQVVPLFAKNALLAYLSKWDIENIELIIAAKSLGRGLMETESFLVSSRNLPLGLTGTVIPFSELRQMLQLPDIESIVNYLVRYGYGSILLQQLGEVRRTGDLGIFSGALQNYYYSRLLWELRFLKGDEGILREYIRAEIAKKNILNLLKSKESNISKDVYAKHIIENGLISSSSLLDAYNVQDISELAKRFEQYFDLTQAVQKYKESGNLTEFEVAMDKTIIRNYLPKMRALPLSINSVFAFLIQVEVERSNIRRITYGKQYNLPEEYIKGLLLVE